MENIQQEKKILRKKVFEINKTYSAKKLSTMSEKIMERLENFTPFKEAKTIGIYHSLKSEVETTNFIKKWLSEKNFYLPVIVEDDMVFRNYISDNSLQKSNYGIQEPLGKDFTDYDKIDLFIVPGVAFDKQLNRMGRGKGYYDRFLYNLNKTIKIGICFDFQLFKYIPVECNDIKMNYIITETEIIGTKITD